MEATISTVYDTSSAGVYGTRFRSYTIDGVEGKSFADVIAHASFKQSHSIERMTAATSALVELRQRKVEDLAEAMAVLNEAVATISTDSSKASDERWSSMSRAKLASANEILKKYGLDAMSTNGDGQINYRTAYETQNDLQTALDTEENDLQQNMTALQALISKRDNAFSTANKIIQKGNATARATINAFGA